jgi:phosphonate transport system permease protein
LSVSPAEPVRAPEGRPLTLVVAPASDHAEGLDLAGLATFLGQHLGAPVKVVHCADYGEAIAALRDGRAEIGWVGPAAYMEAARTGAVHPLAVGVRKGRASPNYFSAFITRADSAIQGLVDIRNKRIALSDRHSTSGYQIPMRELAEAGFDPDNANHFEEVVRVANHDEAIRAVVEGRADVAAVSSINLEEHLASGALTESAVRVIHRSADIPGPPLVCSARLDEALRTRIKDLVLQAHNHIDVGGYGGAMDRYVDPSQGQRKLLESYLRPQWGWRTYLGLLAGVATTGLVMWDLDVNPILLVRDSWKYFGDIFGRMMPPDFSDIPGLARSMLETIEIAALGTLLAIGLSVPLGLLSARNIAPHVTIYLVARVVTVFFRAVPEFIMAMLLVIAVGFGAMPGVVALGLHSMGFLSKFYAEAIEHVKPGPGEALGSLGASQAQVLAFAVIPQVLPSFVANNLYILDRNIRMATMLGIVGAGGIGYELQSSFRMFQYPRVAAIVIVIFVAIFAIDLLSSQIRKRIK